MINTSLQQPNSTPMLDVEENDGEPTPDIVSSGERARAADVTEAIATVRARQDAERKQQAEANELKDNN